MKSFYSFSPNRRALLAAAIVLTTGSAVTAQSTSSSQGTSTSPSTGSSYQSDRSTNSGTDSTRSSSATAGTSDTDASNHSTMQHQQSTTATTPGTSAQKLSWSDRRFITNVAEDNQKEIQLAQLGAQQASSPDVKRFAQQMVEDHTKMGQELQAFASSRQIQLELDTNSARKEEKLSKQTGADFDRDFMKQMIAEHKKVVKSFEDRAEDSKDAELKQFAQAALPKLQHHLQMAQQLEQSIVPTGHTGTESWRANSSTSDQTSTGANPSSSATSDSSGASTSGAASSSSATSMPNAEATGSTGVSGSNSNNPSSSGSSR